MQILEYRTELLKDWFVNHHKTSYLSAIIWTQMAYPDPRKHILHLYQYHKLF